MIAVASLASLTFASFAGCSEDAAPSPTPTATTAACKPDGAEITWKPGSERGLVVVGAYVIRYERESLAWTSSGTSAVQVDPQWDESGLSRIAPSITQRLAWEKQLLVLANRTGQTEGQFGGDLQDLPPDSPATPSKPDRHTYVTTVSVRQYSMPFTISCGPSTRIVTGSVTAPVYTGLRTAIYQCGIPATSDDSQVALGFCPGA